MLHGQRSSECDVSSYRHGCDPPKSYEISPPPLLPHQPFGKLRKSPLANKRGLTYTEFGKTLTPKWRIVWFHLAMGWVALVASNLLIILLSGRHMIMDLLLVGCGSILIGYIIAYLQLFFHEAAHYNLHPDRKI